MTDTSVGALPPLPRPPGVGPVVVAVMDGVGIGREDVGNAVHAADTPFLRGLARSKLYGPLWAHGPAVGLSGADDMGNSEVGHNALGAGQIVLQGASRVASAVRDGTLSTSRTWQTLCDTLQASGGTLHLLGLLSDGNVHAHIEHVLALLQAADAADLSSCALHILLDGRDVGRQSALQYVGTLEAALARINVHPQRDYRIASGGGRMHITMDRYGADWPMVARGYRCHVHGDGPATDSATAAVIAARAAQPDLGDQDLPAFVVHRQGAPAGVMRDGDAVIAWNFRGDRMLELTDAFEADAFAHFERGYAGRARPRVHFVGMTQYDGDTLRPQRFLVAPPTIDNTLGERLARSGLRQLAVSETQKFGHVTYFWNGNRTGAFDATRETYVEVKSSNVPFVDQPAMQAEAIVDATAQHLQTGQFEFARLNFPNGDMIGHTGHFEATVRAMEAVDRALARLCKIVVAQQGGVLLVTADHGNAEDMLERHGKTGQLVTDVQGRFQPKTSHSCNPVPFGAIVPARLRSRCRALPALHSGQAGLANVAATCAQLLGLAPPTQWKPPLLEWHTATQ